MTWHLFMAAFFIFYIIAGINPLDFLNASFNHSSIVKTINFYSQNYKVTQQSPEYNQGWWNGEKILASPEIGENGSFSEYSDENSAFFAGGDYSLIVSEFSASFDKAADAVNNEVFLNEEPVNKKASSTENIIDEKMTVPLVEVIEPEIPDADKKTDIIEEDSAIMANNFFSESVLLMNKDIISNSTIWSANAEGKNQPGDENFRLGELKKTTLKLSLAAMEKLGDKLEKNLAPETESLSEPEMTAEESFESEGVIGQTADSINEPVDNEAGATGIDEDTGIENMEGAEVIEPEQEAPGEITVIEEDDGFDGDDYLKVIELTDPFQSECYFTAEPEFVPTEGESAEAEPLSYLGNLSTKTVQAQENGGLPASEDHLVIWYTLDDMAEGNEEIGSGTDAVLWQQLDIIYLHNMDNAANGGYLGLELPALKDWQDIDRLKIKIEGISEGSSQFVTYLDSVWIEASYEPAEIEEKEDNEAEKTLRTIEAESDFKPGDKPYFRFHYQKKKGKVISQMLESTNLIDYWSKINVRVFLVNAKGSEYELPADMVFEDNGDFMVDFKDFSADLAPGKYRLKLMIEDGSDGETETVEFFQDFTYGVLALNTDKSAYIAGDEAYIQIAALDDGGSTVCDAELKLDIISPKRELMTLSTVDGTIMANPLCGRDNYIEEPDYFALYRLEEMGDYEVILTASTTAGTRTISDKIISGTGTDLSISRKGPTRINPIYDYKMTVSVDSESGYSGDFKELVPAGFILKASSLKIKHSGESEYFLFDIYPEINNLGVKTELVWQGINLAAGDEMEISYIFDAPNVSPALFMLGPAQMDDLIESRQWQIASDAVANSGNFVYGNAITYPGNLQMNTYTDPTTVGTALSTQSTSASAITFVKMAASPTRDEKIAVHQKADGRLDVLTCSGGCNEQTDWTLRGTYSTVVTAANAANFRAFDVAYEQLSGRAMVVFTDDNTTGTAYYCLWDGSSWSPAANCGATFTPGSGNQISTTGVGVTGQPEWVRLVPRGERLTPYRTNEMMLGISDSADDLFLAHWTGSAWDQQANPADNMTTANAQKFNIAWEETTGEALAVVTDTTTRNLSYSTYTAAGGWSALLATGPSNNGNQNYNASLEMASDPLSDDISVIAQDSGSDAEIFVWTGAAFVEGTDDTSGEYYNGKYAVTAWTRTSQRAIFIYTDSNALTSDMECYTAAGGFTSIISDVGNPNISNRDDVDDAALVSSPNNNRMLLTRRGAELVSGTGDDIRALTYSDSTGCADADWTDLGELLNQAAEGGTNGNTPALVHHSAYTPYSPWLKNWRWGEGSSDTPSNLTATNTAKTYVDRNEQVRLRIQVAEMGNQSQTDAKKKLQYTVSADPNSPSAVWTDVAGKGEATAAWRYYDGPGADNDATLASAYVMSGSTQLGPFVENGVSAGSFDQSALAVTEYDFALENYSAATNTLYHFRLYDNTQQSQVFRLQTAYPSAPCENNTVCAYPSLMTAGTIRVTGIVRTADEATPYNCAADNLTIGVVVNGAKASSTTCTLATGAYSVVVTTGQAAGDPIAVFIDSAETPKGTTATLLYSTSTDITNLDIYANRLVVTHENSGPITNAKLATADNNNAGIRYSVAAGALSVEDGIELHIKGGKTFLPGGTIETSTSTAANTADGDIHIGYGAIFNIGSNSIHAGGDWMASGTFSITAPQTTFFTAAATGHTVNATNSPFDSISFNNTTGGWNFIDSATTTGALDIVAGVVAAAPFGTLSIGGDYTNSGTFTANNGTVIFNAGSTGKTVNPGISPFYNVIYNNTLGGWTITGHATSTNDWMIVSAAAFAVAANQVVEVGNDYIISDAVPDSTTWNSGSVLYLKKAAAYTLGTKTQAAESYAGLKIGPNADVRIWNSTSTAYQVDGTASLYSQDHNNTNGSLYVFGDYHISGTDHWSYVTDFDGTDISGSPRIANIKIAANAKVTADAGTLNIAGAAGATTTIANQGSGVYSLEVTTGGTINAGYYLIRNTDSSGLKFSGTPAITSLNNGDYELSVNGGAMITAASTAIDNNPGLTISSCSFATSTGISTGYNTVLSGTPASYWVFQGHYGNYDGENYDSDPGAGAGYLRWDDSYGSISVSGYIYQSDGETPIGGTVCDGETPTVSLKLNGAGTHTAVCNPTTGYYLINNIILAAGEQFITVYLNTDGGPKAVTVYKSPNLDIVNMNLSENQVIVRSESGDKVTIDNLNYYDSGQDTDIPYLATNSTPDTLVLEADTEFRIYNGVEFAPGGNITITPIGSGQATDGTLYLETGAVFTAAGTETHTVGGDMTLAAGAVFTPANSTVVFTATTSGKTIDMAGSSFYNLTLNGAGGNWSGSSAITVVNDLDIAAGTLSGTADVTVKGGDASGAGIITLTGGTFTLESSGNFGGSNNWYFNDLVFGSGSAAGATAKAGSGNIEISGAMAIKSQQTLQAGAIDWTLAGSGQPFVASGTLQAETSRFQYTAAANTIIATTTYYRLILAPAAAGSPIYTIASGTMAVGDYLYIGDGANPVTVTAAINDPEIDINGNLEINTGAEFIASDINLISIGGNYANSGTFTANNGSVVFDAGATGKTVNSGTSPFYDVSFNSALGGWTIVANATSTNDWTIANAAAFAVSAGKVIEVDGEYGFSDAIPGITTWDSGSMLYLNKGTAYTVATKTQNKETYEALKIGANTDVRIWNSTSSAYAVDNTASLYSMDHDNSDGSLYIFGDYHVTGADYWNYNIDFDGADISASPRAANVRLAANATTTVDGGSLGIIGAATATTTIACQGSGAYSLEVATGGTINAGYYQIRNTDINGLKLSGTPVVTSLDNGDFELSIDGGAMVTAASTAIDNNPGLTNNACSFATSTGISSGYNIVLSGSPSSYWTFVGHYGNYDGEIYDNDEASACGHIRWSDSVCPTTLEQSHFRIRNDDGAERGWIVRQYTGNMGANATLAVPITAVKATTSAFILAPAGNMSVGRGSLAANQNANEVLIRARLTAVDTVTLTRGAATNDSYYSFYVIEDAGGGEIRVRSGSDSFVNATDADLDISISGITNASNTAVFLTTSSDNAGTTVYNEAHVKGLMTNGTNLRLTRTAGTAIAAVDWFVVEFIRPGWTVQQGEFTLTTGTHAAPQTQAINSVTAANSLVFMNWSADTNGMDTVSAKVELYNSTTLRFSRQDTTSGSCSIAWFVISNPDMAVQRNSDYAAATDSTEDQAITAVDTNRSFPLTFNDSNQGGGAGARAFPQPYWRAWLSASTTLNWDRAYAGNDNNFFWQVAQLPHGGATWQAAEDEPATSGQTIGENFRLRFSVMNTGEIPSDSQRYVLQAAPQGNYAGCASVPTLEYSNVTTSGGAAVMAASSYFATQASTTAQMASVGTFTEGLMVESPDTQTNQITINTGEYTELEYNLQFVTAAVRGETYCFRAARSTGDIDTYNQVAAVKVENPKVSGYAYADEASTIWNGCNGSTANISVISDGVFIASTSCSASTGYYEIKNIPMTAGGSIAVLFNNNGGNTAQGAAFTVPADSHGNISLDIIKDRIKLATETGIGAIANTQLDDCSADGPAACANMPYKITGGDITISTSTKLIIAAGKTYSPGGDVTLLAGADPAGAGGDLLIEGGAVLDAAGNAVTVGNDLYNYGTLISSGGQTFKIGGDWNAAGSNLDLANTIIEFTATTTGNTITTGGRTLYSLNFNGAGGSWILADNATTTATTTISQGTLIQGSGVIFEIRSLLIANGASFTKASGGRLIFEGDGKEGYIEDLNAVPNDLGDVVIGYSPATTNLNSDFSATSLTVNSGDTFNSRGYEVTVSGAITINGTYNTTDSREGDGTITSVGTNWTVGASAAFDSSNSTTTFSGTGAGTLSSGGTDANHDFYNISFAKASAAAITLANNAITVSNNLTIGANSTLDVSALNYAVSAAGNWTNAGTFNAQQGTVAFTAGTSGKSIDPGSSAFYDINFNNAAGGWTIIAHATSTRNWSITNAAAFTVAANKVIEVKGDYIISDAIPSITVWNSGSMLYLNKGAAYTVATKTQSAESYAGLKIGANTDIKMWNSISTAYQVDSTGSLYSMDHNNTNGSLYIFGDYRIPSASEYWSYATDFDGVDISVSPRTVDVKLANGAAVTLEGGSLNIIGAAAATTTVANQGSGTYGLAATSGTLNANYYKIRNTDLNGLNISGAPVIVSLDYGDYELSAEGGAMISLAAAVMDANRFATSTACSFATSTGISSGYNVKLNGSPDNNWLFESSYGNYDGDSFDSDPGDPRGYIAWDDSPDFDPKSQNWRWYYDIDKEEPANPAALENASPSTIGPGVSLKLRMTIGETAGISGYNVKMALQYSTEPDFSADVHDAGEIGSTTAVWTYADGFDSDNDPVLSRILSDSTGNGAHNEAGESVSTFTHAANAINEYEFTIYNNNGADGTVYYFRAYADYESFGSYKSASVAINTGESYPSLVTTSASLDYVISGLPANTNTEGIVTDVGTEAAFVQFGLVPDNIEREAAQRMVINTNADYGYRLFVYQRQSLVSDSGNSINPISGTNESPASWAIDPNPSGFGYHTGDDTLSGTDPSRFSADNRYAAFETGIKEIGYSPIPVTDDSIDFVYKLQATGAQEAGAYQSEIVYIIVPSF